MSIYKQGDLIEKKNPRTGFNDKEIFKVITDFKTDRKYADFLSLMYVNRFVLFMSYVVATNMFLKNEDCPLSEFDKARNSAVINTLIAMFHVRDKDRRTEEQKEHEEYQESLFAYLDNHGKKSKKE